MKRRLLIAAIFLLAGGVVNVAVAWGIALGVNPHDRPLVNQVAVELRGGTILRISQRAAFGTVSFSCPGRTRILQQGRVFPTIRDVLPRWASRHELYTGTSNSIKGSGWPLLVLSASIYRMHGLDSPGYEVFGGIQTPLEPFTYGGLTLPKGFALPPGVTLPTLLGSRTIPRVLPLRPIWPGFVVNTLLYAVVLWLLSGGPFRLRRFIRVKRGRCPACAYPTGQSDACSECGKPLPGRTVTT